MFKKYTIGLILLLISMGLAMAQDPVASFNVGSTFCRNQFLNLQNTSVNAQSYQWDFCLEDFSTLLSSGEAATISGLSGGYGYRLVQDNNNWFGFVTSVNNNKLFRLHYGNSLSNIPVITDLGNLGKLVLPEGIDLIKENGNWYGFVGSLDFSSPTQGVIRLDFGNSLLNVPTAVNLGNFGYNVRFREVKIVKQDTDLILIAINYNEGSLIRINYRNSFTNSIGPADIYDSGPIANASLPIGIDLVKKNSNWIGILASLANNELIQLNFGSDLLTVPSVQAHYIFPSVSRPYKARIIQEGNKYYGVISNETLPLAILDLKDLDPVNTPVQLTTATLPVLLGVDGVRLNGKNTIMGVGSTGTALHRMIFESNCNVSKTFSDQQTPSDVYYGDTGAQTIELIAFGTDPSIRSVAATTLTVSSAVAPDIAFNSQNVCAQHDMIFSSQNTSGDITAYAWNFGDSQTSAQPNPIHSYAGGGDYTVSLLVTASNGCQNSFARSLTVYNPPQANFILPTAGTICTNQEYPFTNTTSYDAGLVPTWQWQIDNVNQSVEKDGSFAFPAASTYEVKLTASIPGCSSSLTQNFNVQSVGPSVDFAMSGVCQNDPVEFASSITGQFNSLQWNFGDGAISTSYNPTHNYTSIGNYDIQLTAINASGCQNSATKSLTIRSQPQPDFSLALPPFSCAGSASQFTDLTASMPDSNVNGWAWTFGDAAQGTSTIKNAAYTYSQAGDYLVALAATTNFGCTASIEKTVTISPSPTAAFTNAAACMSQGTLFTDVSGTDIKAWLWTMQSSTYTTKNPTHIFSATGQHPVTLAVTASNNCVSQIEKSITVPVPVSINFMGTSTCATLPTTFTETTVSGSDPAVAWSWDFSGTTGNGSPIQHTFTNVGTYPVKLSSTRQSGCTYSVAKSISIIQPPVASFNVPFTSGPAPLTIGFTNTSTQASSYLWKFNDSDNSTSTAFSPSFVFEELGTYPVELVASNSAGCSDSFVTDIHVVVPNMNAAITDFVLSPNPDGTWKAIVTIENRSNMAITNPEVFIDLAGRTQIKERVTATLQPNQIYTQQISTDFIVSNLSYVCAEVRLPNDVYAFDDSQCATLTNESIALAPYPNPVSDELNLNWINQGDEQLRITIFNSSGQVVMDQEYNPLLPELNQVKVDVSGLKPGIYYVSFKTGSQQSNHRLAVIR